MKTGIVYDPIYLEHHLSSYFFLFIKKDSKVFS